MPAEKQKITEDWAMYLGDCCEVLPDIPDESVHLSVYSPPFAAEGGGCLYHYSSSDRDLSNCRSYDEFFEHYRFIVAELLRVSLPGRLTAVHCIDIPRKGDRGMIDLPGDVIRLHEEMGWRFWARHFIWKEPLGVRCRTMARGLAHKQVVEDASLCDVAGADQLILFRKPGDNPVPVDHPEGLFEYYGARQIPASLKKFRGWEGKQRDNEYSHWIWRQYASAFWDDVRGNLNDRNLDKGGILSYKPAKDEEDERHMHPLQLDVIRRVVILRTNPGETVLSPFAGVGSEMYAAVELGRKGIGVELKPSYCKQAIRNLKSLKDGTKKIRKFSEQEQA